MALPQKVLDQLSREPPRTPGWAWQFLMFGSAVFFIALLVYVGLVFGYKPFLSSQLKKTQDKIQAFGQQIPVEEQAKIVNFYSQIVNLKSLIEKHVFTSLLFEWLEKNTQGNVYFEKMDLNTVNSRAILNGVAKNIEDVTQQIAIFESRPEVERVGVGTVNFSAGAWRFGTTLYFSRGYFLRDGAQL